MNSAWINDQSGGPVTISSHLGLDDYGWKALSLTADNTEDFDIIAARRGRDGDTLRS